MVDEPQLCLPAPMIQDYVVIVAAVVETAIVPACSEREAAEKFMAYDDKWKDEDVAILAMTRDEFDTLMKGEAMFSDTHDETQFSPGE